MSSCSFAGCWRFFLMGIIAVFAVMLLGADYPELEQQKPAASVVARELCSELSPELRQGMLSAAGEDPVWVIQIIAE